MRNKTMRANTLGAALSASVLLALTACGRDTGAEYAAGLIPPGTHDWSKFLPPEEMVATLEGLGMEVDPRPWRGVSGIVLASPPNPLALATAALGRGAGSIGGTLRWRLDADDTKMNYIVHATKPSLQHV